MHRLLLSIFVVAVVSACSGQKSVLDHPTTSATLWTQNSAEYQALTRSVYQMAAANLGLAIEDSYWTADLEQKKADNYQNLPPAIILDVDETVLDNSPYQARMIEQNSSFDPEQWDDWVMEAQADAVPGAVEFTSQAAEEGITVFYLTNREASVEEGTRENLQDLGFPLESGEDVILSNNEHENWTSDKIERRSYVAENYRILMLFGDDLNDFTYAKEQSMDEREQIVKENANKWGRQWFILPNPVYGSWENALYNFDSSLSDSDIQEIKESLLDTKN